MSVYTPDNWVIVEIKGEEGTFYKVLAGWVGGYLSGDSWRMNSGIARVEEDDDSFYFYGKSGSVYECFKKYYGMRSNTSEVFARLVENFGSMIYLMPEETDWKSLDFSVCL